MRTRPSAPGLPQPRQIVATLTVSRVVERGAA
jgi:hypothetical protein